NQCLLPSHTCGCVDDSHCRPGRYCDLEQHECRPGCAKRPGAPACASMCENCTASPNGIGRCEAIPGCPFPDMAKPPDMLMPPDSAQPPAIKSLAGGGVGCSTGGRSSSSGVGLAALALAALALVRRRSRSTRRNTRED